MLCTRVIRMMLESGPVVGWTSIFDSFL